MARKASTPAEAVPDEQPAVDADQLEDGGDQAEQSEQPEASTPAEAVPPVDGEAGQDSHPEGELDVEAWVAAVYDYQHNEGPYPERTYRVAPAEPVHVDSVGVVLVIDRDPQEG